MSSSYKPETAENPTSQGAQIVAFDLSKEHLVAETSKWRSEHPNSRAGYQSILDKLPTGLTHLFVFEATGCSNSAALMDFLEQRGLPYCQVHANRIAAFALSEGIRAKTDRIDAHTIYRYACSKHLKPTRRPSAPVRELQALLDRRTQLLGTRTKEQARLQDSPKIVHADLRESIAFLDRHIERIEARIRKLIAGDAELAKALKMITAIKGVGEVNAWTILAYFSELDQLGRKQAVALAGLAPYNRDSGKHKGKRYISGGRAKLRRSLYMAAQSAARHNEHIRTYANRLLERGKSYDAVMVAVMRKLLLCIQSLLKGNDPLKNPS